MRRLLCLFLLLTLPAQAQGIKTLPVFQSAPVGITVGGADWSQFSLKPQASAPKPDFYLRCMSGPDPVLSDSDQRAMCACMAAHQAQVDASEEDRAWYSMLARRVATPYETFVTKVYAPCMFVEARPVALDDCHARTNDRIVFANQGRFEQYCTCYAQAAERYTRAYAQPLMAAKLAENEQNGLQALSDPSRLVTGDGDYQIYMAARRQDCMRQFQIDNMRPR